MSEKTTEYDMGQAVRAAGIPAIELSATGSEWLKLPSGEYINMARVERVTFYPETFDPQDDAPSPPVVILDMGHRTAVLRGDDIAAVLAALDRVTVDALVPA